MRENREPGEILGRTRHCNGERLLDHFARRKDAIRNEPKSGDLPGKVHSLTSRISQLE